MQKIAAILADIVQERARQDRKFPGQVGVSFPDTSAEIPDTLDENTCREACERAFAERRPTWAHILIEEVAEVIEPARHGDLEALRTELIQVAAVAVKWIEDLDARRAAPTGPPSFLEPGWITPIEPTRATPPTFRLTLTTPSIDAIAVEDRPCLNGAAPDKDPA